MPNPRIPIRPDIRRIGLVGGGGVAIIHIDKVGRGGGVYLGDFDPGDGFTGGGFCLPLPFESRAIGILENYIIHIGLNLRVPGEVGVVELEHHGEIGEVLRLGGVVKSYLSSV